MPPSRRLAITHRLRDCHVRPSCPAIIVPSRHSSSPQAGWLFESFKLTMGGWAPHPSCAISLLDTCATLFGADSGLGKPIVLLGRMLYHCVACRSFTAPLAPHFACRGCYPRCCCHSSPRLATTASHRMPHTAAVSQSLWRAPPLGRMLYPRVARRSFVAPLVPHIASAATRRLASLPPPRDHTPHATVRRTPHATARRTPHAAQHTCSVAS